MNKNLWYKNMVKLCSNNLCRRIYPNKLEAKSYDLKKMKTIEQVISLESLLVDNDPIVSIRLLTGIPMLYTDLYMYLPSNFVVPYHAGQIKVYKFIQEYDLIDPMSRMGHLHRIIKLDPYIPEHEKIIDYFYDPFKIDDIIDTYWNT